MIMTETERLAECKRIALRMYTAGLGWRYDAIERLTRPVPAQLRTFMADNNTLAVVSSQALEMFYDTSKTWKRRYRTW